MTDARIAPKKNPFLKKLSCNTIVSVIVTQRRSAISPLQAEYGHITEYKTMSSGAALAANVYQA